MKNTKTKQKKTIKKSAAKKIIGLSVKAVLKSGGLAALNHNLVLL